ncbi:hypothetical protein E4U43_007245 [Claviceps pusilla]|uniref:Uncharacterized protein n=1 Tax=Claviceps pusilla TaxID=123648 RepID=A0A9P7SZ91_9HYPO|nr:hypothetical protein E4U43_007245 [Claviceps pusilla]
MENPEDRLPRNATRPRVGLSKTNALLASAAQSQWQLLSHLDSLDSLDSLVSMIQHESIKALSRLTKWSQTSRMPVLVQTCDLPAY